MKHVGYLTGRFPRPSDTFIQNEVLGLREQGWTVSTYSVQRPTEIVSSQQSTLHDDTFYIYEKLKSKTALKAATSSIKSPSRLFKASKLAAKCAKRAGAIKGSAYLAEAVVLAEALVTDGVEHLHCHFADASCTVGMLAAQIADIPYSFTIHGPGIFFEPQKWSLDTKAANAEFVVCISNFCVSQLRIFTDRSDWDKFNIVHCGVDTNVSEPASESSEILFVGRLEDLKGPHDLIQAFAAIVEQDPQLNPTLRFVGDGPARSSLESQVETLELGDKVFFEGYAPPNTVSQLLSKAAVFCLPSYAEGVPVSLMEAMVHSIPVVSTKVGGITELIEDGESGYLIAPGAIDELSKALTDLLSDAAKRTEMGQVGARKVVEEFSAQGQISALVKLFGSQQ